MKETDHSKLQHSIWLLGERKSINQKSKLDHLFVLESTCTLSCKVSFSVDICFCTLSISHSSKCSRSYMAIKCFPRGVTKVTKPVGGGKAPLSWFKSWFEKEKEKEEKRRRRRKTLF